MKEMTREAYGQLMKGILKVKETQQNIEDLKKKFGQEVIEAYLVELMVECLIIFDITFYSEKLNIEAKRLMVQEKVKWYNI